MKRFIASATLIAAVSISSSSVGAPAGSVDPGASSPADAPASALATPSDPASAFERANASFAAGDYAAAAEGFERIVDTWGVSTALLYDLANSEAKAGRPGEAILHYERALALSPRDPDVLANLRQTRASTGLPVPERSRWEELASAGTVDGWAGGATLALWGLCALIAVRGLRTTEPGRPSRGVAAAAAALACAALVAGALARTRLLELRRAVVLGPVPELRVAPFASATVSVELLPGQIVDIERAHDEFVLVRTAEGQAGWLPRDQAPEIVPP